MTPTIPQIIAHGPAGGLWRAIPKRTEEGQPRPLFARLGIVQGIRGPVATYEGGDLRATIENTQLLGAEWVPVDSRGDRV